jgi:multidrug transporter EmrE-like cation transporter
MWNAEAVLKQLLILLTMTVSACFSAGGVFCLKKYVTELKMMSINFGMMGDWVVAATRPYFWGGLMCYAVALLGFLFLLSQLPVSRFVPTLVSVNILLTVLMGWMVLGEVLSGVRCVGVAFIVLGVILVSQP